MYDPQVGRWISEDPIGFDGGDANLSRYVGNAPTNFVDPSGLAMMDSPTAAPAPPGDESFVSLQAKKEKPSGIGKEGTVTLEGMKISSLKIDGSSIKDDKKRTEWEGKVLDNLKVIWTLPTGKAHLYVMGRPPGKFQLPRPIVKIVPRTTTKGDYFHFGEIKDPRIPFGGTIYHDPTDDTRLDKTKKPMWAGLANELSHAGRAQTGSMDLRPHPRRIGAVKDDDASNKFENDLIKEYNAKYKTTFPLRKPY